jgi:hypothetical protein
MDLIKWLSHLRSELLLALATKFHYLILIGIVAGIGVTLLINRPDFAIRGIIYIVPGILISIVLWKLYKKGEKYPDSLVLIQANEKIFPIIFVIIFIFSLLALYFSVYRPWYYFLLLTALFCIIFLQIFNKNLKPSQILFEISCVLGNLIFGLQLKYPLYFGFTDIISHLYLSQVTLLSGHIIPEDLSFGYAWFPLYHIFIAEGTTLLGIDVKLSFILLTSISFILLIWVIYLLFNNITGKSQTALLVCLFFSTTPIVITYSTYVVTRVMAFIGFFFFLYLAHKQVQTSKWRSFSILTILFSIYLILVHQVSILQILCILAVFIGLEILINDYFVIKTKIIVFIIVTFSTYWLYTSLFFTSIILESAESITTPELSQLKSQVTGYEFIFLRDNITTAIIIFFVILGIAYFCWAYKSKYPSVIGLFVLIMVPLYFPSPITASEMAMVTFRTDRFTLLISPFFAFAAATGFLFLLYMLYGNTHSRKIAIVFGLLIFSYLCYSAVTAENALDSMDLPTHQTRHHFIETEMSTFNFFPQFIENNSTITSDKSATRMFEQPYFSKTEALKLPAFYSVDTFDSGDIYTFESEFFVLRNQELVDNGLDFPSGKLGTGNWYGASYGPTPEVIAKFSDMTYNSHKIYDNREVSILVNRLQ